jgi:cytosine/adenosine deaminase-related metal-dependent hydrolase
LRGRFGNMTFMEYMVAGNIQSFNYTPEDIFWGQLAGCQESIYSGVTTVVDHAHMTYSPEHGAAPSSLVRLVIDILHVSNRSNPRLGVIGATDILLLHAYMANQEVDI